MEGRKNISTAVVSCSRSNEKILQIKIILWTLEKKLDFKNSRGWQIQKIRSQRNSTIIQILSKYNRTFQKKKKKTTLKNTLYCHVFLKAKNFNDQAIKNFDPISSKGKRAPLKTIKSNPNRIASTVHFETDPPLPRRKFMRPSVASIGCNVT